MPFSIDDERVGAVIDEILTVSYEDFLVIHAPLLGHADDLFRRAG